LRARVAVLEIRAPGAANQQGIAGEYAITTKEAVGIISVPRCLDNIERQTLY